jgi:hypothetical protein
VDIEQGEIGQTRNAVGSMKVPGSEVNKKIGRGSACETQIQLVKSLRVDFVRKLLKNHGEILLVEFAGCSMKSGKLEAFVEKSS